jgi:teichuronic acid biosynthesis glycosyltransferase TuaC
MKILLISNIFPNSADKERGIFTYRIAMALKPRCRMEVIAPLPWVPHPLRKGSRGKHIYARVPFNEAINGLVVYHPRYLAIPKLGFMHPLFMFVPLLRLIRHLEGKERIDLINAHWIFPDGVAASWVAQKMQKPLVLTGLGCDLNHYPLLPFRRKQIQKALNLAKLITVKGNGLKCKVLDMGIPKQKVSVIPNGLDLKRFKIMGRKDTRQRLGIHGNGPFFLFVGSLDHVKGGRHLIEAIGGIAKNNEHHPHLLMVGDGPLHEALLLQAKQLGIANRVSFVGKRPHNEIPLWMNAADVFCLPSIREGRPNVLLEALSCGTPAVASDVGAVSEIIHEGNGRIAGVADPKSLFHQLLACLKQPWDRKAIRETVGRFTWDDCAELYMRTFQQIVSENFQSNM